MNTTICEPRELLAAPDKRTGHFYVMLVCPDLSSKRVKLGFADDVNRRRKSFSTISPTIKVVKSWPCTQDVEASLIFHATLPDCKQIGGEVFDVASVDELVRRIDEFFVSGVPEWNRWRLFTKIDIALKKRFEAYSASLEYPVDQARIIERAFREFLERQGFWPHKPDSNCSGSK